MSFPLCIEVRELFRYLYIVAIKLRILIPNFEFELRRARALYLMVASQAMLLHTVLAAIWYLCISSLREAHGFL